MYDGRRTARPGGVALNPNTQRPQCMIFGCGILNNANCCFYCHNRDNCTDPCQNHPDRCGKCIYPTKWKDKMVKVFVSQPMRNKSEEEIRKNIEIARRYAEDLTRKRVHILETYFPSYAKLHPITALARSLDMLSKADLCIFMPGWEEARGCNIEHETVLNYGIKAAYIKEEEE